MLKELYGDGSGGPDAAKAEEILAAAGVTIPVALSLQYNPDHYGPSSGDEYALVKSQLEADGLFTVDLQSTEWVQYSEDRTADMYPVVPARLVPGLLRRRQLPDAVLPPEQLPGQPLRQPGSQRPHRFSRPSTPDPAERTALIEEIQAKVGADLSTVPLLQGAQVAVSGTDIDGLVLDASFKFRFATLVKG